MNSKEILDIVSETLDDLYKVNDTLPDDLYDQLKILSDGIYKMERVYDELKLKVQIQELYEMSKRNLTCPECNHQMIQVTEEIQNEFYKRKQSYNKDFACPLCEGLETFLGNQK
jgi:uncharacterized protein with PIN domain